MSDSVFIQIGDYVIDAAINEDHSFDSDVTDHPVETGADITDNIRAKPVQVTLDCVVSDTPIGAVASLRGNTDDNGQPLYKPSSDAYATMIAIRDARLPVTIVTSLATFENMALVSLSVPRNAQNGDALRFKATFKQIKFITNDRTTVRVADPRAATSVSKGALSAKDEAAQKAAADDSLAGNLLSEFGQRSVPSAAGSFIEDRAILGLDQ